MAPSKPGRARSSRDRYRYCGQVSANTFCPVSRAVAIAARACAADRCTTYSGAPVTSASVIARGVASLSSSGGRVSPCCTGVGLPARPAPRATSWSIAMPFSACIMISAPLLGGLLHGPDDLAVGRVEHAGVGHEHLEAGHARVDAGVHLLQRGVVDVRHDHVEAVVDRAVAVRLGVPLVQRGLQRRALGLDREVDDRGRAAPGRGPGAGLERVRGERAAERHLHVRVRVDAARQHVLGRRVDDPLGLGRPGWPARSRARPAR